MFSFSDNWKLKTYALFSQLEICPFRCRNNRLKKTQKPKNFQWHALQVFGCSMCFFCWQLLGYVPDGAPFNRMLHVYKVTACLQLLHGRGKRKDSRLEDLKASCLSFRHESSSYCAGSGGCPWRCARMRVLRFFGWQCLRLIRLQKNSFSSTCTLWKLVAQRQELSLVSFWSLWRNPTLCCSGIVWNICDVYASTSWWNLLLEIP